LKKTAHALHRAGETKSKENTGELEINTNLTDDY